VADIKIQWLTDSHDCETCGSTYAEGARVTIDGKVEVEMLPVAHCFGGDDYSPSDVFAAVLAHYGHTVSEEQSD